MNHVNVWEEEVLIPTYGVGQPEKNPIFLEKRVYQGSSGAVYPYPVIEKIENEAKPMRYKAVYLENEYLKIMVLPELGGRIQMAYDKIAGRHFIYYNQVIKPALVGLTGPWISGGIEFNWPQHHRPSTFMPVDHTIERMEDGSAAVWVSERERMFHQKGTAGFILRPGKAVLEIQGKLYNPTPLPQTFLWWANPAVAVNEHYQSVFPDDVHAVFDHGKRDVSEYPIARGTYYKVDYAPGTDISRYKNIPVPTSYMAVNSKYNFIGGYENDTRAGMLHVANHHLSPGKKQWTWGNGDFGRAWDRNLTDEDGPYIELMTGVFTDNQPDFSWLQPYEEKTFTQYFMPYRELGVVKNASADLMLNIEQHDGEFVCKVFATSAMQDISVTVSQNGLQTATATTALSPEKVFTLPAGIGDLKNTSVVIRNAAGKELLAWSDNSDTKREMPQAAKAAPSPEEIETAEELFLWGLHLEQYRHATYDPADYYREALRRFPNDIRNNNALGLRLIRRGCFAEAEPYLRQAVATLTEHNPNPYDGEPLYNLGLSLLWQDKTDEAYDYFYKACWNAAWQGPGYFALAQISCWRKEWECALEQIDAALLSNWHNHRARHLKTAILRKLRRISEALELIRESLAIDHFNTGCIFERLLISGAADDASALRSLMRGETHNYEELMLDYSGAGLLTEAIRVADEAIVHTDQPSPMIWYYRSWFLFRADRHNEALVTIRDAETQPVPPCFPNALEAIAALETVVSFSEYAPRAGYYLGNLWYDKRQYDKAIVAWRRSAEEDAKFPTVLRNLSLAYFNKLGCTEQAVYLLEKAFTIDTADARILMELDQLYKRLNKPHRERLALLETYYTTAFSRDDLYLEYATLLNQTGNFAEAVAMIEKRRFHPWEGGEGKVPRQYQIAKTSLAKQCIATGDHNIAIAHLHDCLAYPENFGEGKLHGTRENDLWFLLGRALELSGKYTEATEAFRLAAIGENTPSDALYYNDQQPDKILYKGLALKKLGHYAEASACFSNLTRYGQQHLHDRFKMDYFAVSLPDLLIWEDDMDKRNAVQCNYLMGLGASGTGDTEKACMYFSLALSLDINAQGAQIHNESLMNFTEVLLG